MNIPWKFIITSEFTSFCGLRTLKFISWIFRPSKIVSHSFYEVKCLHCKLQFSSSYSVFGIWHLVTWDGIFGWKFYAELHSNSFAFINFCWIPLTVFDFHSVHFQRNVFFWLLALVLKSCLKHFKNHSEIWIQWNRMHSNCNLCLISRNYHFTRNRQNYVTRLRRHSTQESSYSRQSQFNLNEHQRAHLMSLTLWLVTHNNS